MQDSESVNIERWRKSGLPEQWVRARHAHWNHHDWLRLLEDLRLSDYWPMRPDDIGSVLESCKQEFGRAVTPRALAPVAAESNELPAVQLTEPAIEAPKAGSSQRLSLLALCVAVLLCVAKYTKRRRSRRIAN